MKYPNYYHFFNIQNILFDEKMKDDIDYQKPSNQEITVIISIEGQPRNGRYYLRQSIRDLCKYENINMLNYNLIYYGKLIDENSCLEDIINEVDKKKK